LERSEKGVKDVKRGRVSVAVLGKMNGVLPPKANRDTRNVREKWLKGHRGEGPKAKGKGGKGVGRKVERKGFGVRGFVRDE
jgi:U3 small nucleolar RNA-associated protein 16